MSGYTVIHKASLALRYILWEGFQADDLGGNISGGSQGIVFTNPKEAAEGLSGSAGRLSLWLYNITENAFMRNDPRHREEGVAFPSLPIDLSYLITPIWLHDESDLLMIGKVMQILNDTPVVVLSGDGTEPVHEELRVLLNPLRVDDMSRVWEALQQPYRLSVGYLVRVARIDSLKPYTTGEIRSRVLDTGSLATGLAAAA